MSNLVYESRSAQSVPNINYELDVVEGEGLWGLPQMGSAPKVQDLDEGSLDRWRGLYKL